MFIGPNADVIEWTDAVGFSVAGEWALCTLTAECADMVSDPSEESLLSNAPGVNRKAVREGVRDGVDIPDAEDLLCSRIRFRTRFGWG
jgi:hypothetical protein